MHRYRTRLDTETHKICTTCNVLQVRENFHKSKIHHDGLSYYCKDCVRETFKNRYKGRYNGRRTNYSRSVPIKTAELRRQVFNMFGNKCLKCGFDDARALQIDHINGGGNKHVRSVFILTRYRAILKDPTGFQLLCANCNWIKRYENKEYGRRTYSIE